MESITVNYDARFACFYRLITNFFAPQPVGPAFEALFQKVLETPDEDFEASFSETGKNMEAIRAGKALILNEVDVTDLFRSAALEYEKTLSAEEVGALQHCAQRLALILRSETFQNALSWLTRFFGLPPEKPRYHVHITPFVPDSFGRALFAGSNDVFIQDMSTLNAYMTHHQKKPLSDEDMAGIVAHEIVHILIHRTIGNVNALKQKETDPYAEFALKYLEDSLTTVFGNRIIRDLLEPGTKNAAGAYDDPFFDRCSLEILPIAEEYLKRGRSLDSAFIHEFVAIFKRTFPDSLQDFRCLIYDAPFVSDWDTVTLMSLVQPFFFTQISTSIPWEKRGRVSTPRIFVLNNSRAEKKITLSGRKDYLWVRHDAEGRLVITIQTNDTAKIQKALQWMHDKVIQKEEIVIAL